MSAATATQWIEAFDAGKDRDLARTKGRILQFLKSSPEPFLRTNFDPGHVTASGIVVSPDLSCFLIVRHRRLRKWLQPGGHLEPEDPDTHRAAEREVIEETQVTLHQSTPELVGLDIHPIPATSDEPDHLHHDMAFLLFAADDALGESGENLSCTWCPWDSADSFNLDSSVRRHAWRAKRRIGSGALPIII